VEAAPRWCRVGCGPGIRRRRRSLHRAQCGIKKRPGVDVLGIEGERVTRQLVDARPLARAEGSLCLIEDAVDLAL